jgi:putative membrane protein
MVDEMGWWTIPIVCLVIFTLYGIDGIGSQLEDPFGYDRNDIKMDAIVEDERVEIEAILSEWRKVTAVVPEANGNGETNGTTSHQPREMFLRQQ